MPIADDPVDATADDGATPSPDAALATRAPSRDPLVRAFDAMLGRLDAVGYGRAALAIVIFQAVVLCVVSYVAPGLGPREPFAGSWPELIWQGSDLPSVLVSHLQRWDALWYQRIAEVGYGPSDGSAAFAPLYPGIGYVATRLVGIAAPVALLACSAICYVGGLWLVGRLADLEVRSAGARPATDRDASIARSALIPVIAMLAIATFPTGFFFLAPFTESLFLLVTVAAFLAARSGHPIVAGLLGGLAALARIQGVFLVLPLGWEALRSAGLLARPIRVPRPAAVVGIVAAGAPFLAYLGWSAALSTLLGADRLGLDAQAPWGYQLVAPWQALGDSLAYIATYLPSPRGLVELLNLACLVVFALLAVRTLRLPISYPLYAFPVLALFATRSLWFEPLMSVGRYVVTLFPCFLALAILLARWPRVALAVLAGGAIAQVLLFQYFVRWGFVA